MLSIVTTMFNEEACIGEFLQRTLGVLRANFSHYEVIVIDDGSHDRSLEIVKAHLSQGFPIHVYVLSRNYGHEAAMTAGLQHARGDFVVLMDSDLQDPPELIPDLVHKIQQGFDVVYAERLSRAGETWLKRASSKAFYRLCSRLTGFNIPDNAGDFRVFRREVVESLNTLKEHNRYLKMLYAYVGYRVASVPYHRQARHGGKSKYNYLKLINAALDAIISFSNKPLRAMSIASLGISFLTLLYAGFVVVQKLFIENQPPSGWSSIMFFISGLFSVLFLFLAIISEYLGRILVETKQRPLYYIREAHHPKEAAHVATVD